MLRRSVKAEGSTDAAEPDLCAGIALDGAAGEEHRWPESAVSAQKGNARVKRSSVGGWGRREDGRRRSGRQESVAKPASKSDGRDQRLYS